MKQHISYSELIDWTKCPYLHKLKWLGEREKIGTIHTCFGTAIHNGCETLVKNEYEARSNNNIYSFNKKEINTDFKKCFREELKKTYEARELDFSNPEEKDKKLIVEMLTQAEGIFPNILPALQTMFSNYEVVGTEYELMEPIGSYTEKEFKGFIDLVLKVGNRYVILDWKTCSWGWDARKKSNKLVSYQLTFYKHFFAQKMKLDIKDIDCYFVLLKRTAATKNNIEFVKVPAGQRKIDNSLELLEQAIYNIENGNHFKNFTACKTQYGYCQYYETEKCKRR